MEINGILKEMLDSIKCIPAELGACDYDTDVVPRIDEIEEQIREVAPEVAIYNGCTKCAIVDKTCDYVIKIPFRGMWYEAYNDEDCGEDFFEEFQYANDLEGYDDVRQWDYCENELIKYEKAVDAGFSEFFAETAYYGRINNTPVYIQEKAMSFMEKYNELPEPSNDAVKKYTENKDKLSCCITSKWVELAIDWYGFDKVVAFIDYLYDENLNNDLHSGNIGFTEAGKPVLIDWAGFRD